MTEDTSTEFDRVLFPFPCLVTGLANGRSVGRTGCAAGSAWAPSLGLTLRPQPPDTSGVPTAEAMPLAAVVL